MTAPLTGTTPPKPAPVARPALAFGEFVTMMALLMSLMALSIDAMLPALPEIARDVTPAAPNLAQLVIPFFLLGVGLGTILMGPLSDTFGRKPVIVLGVGIYIAASLLASASQGLGMLLLARVLEGVGIAAPRIAGIALVRDIYAGRRMAQVMSIVMTIFIVVPAAAPFLGQGVIWLAGWRAVFLAFVVIGMLALLWLGLRQPETLPAARRRAFRPRDIIAAAREVVSNRLVLLYMAALSLGFGQMFGLLSTAQPIYDVAFNRAASFPAWFALMALIAGTAGLVNAAFVMRLGMRRIVAAAFTAQSLISGVMVLAWGGGLVPADIGFAVFFAWSTSVFFMAGVVFGNLNALCLEPLGHIAGVAASIVGAVSTTCAVLVAIPIGLAFDGTPFPLMISIFICSSVAMLVMRATRRAETSFPKG
ncbi:DHA1 family bicyclomycin/chloramphenicol resistance-like MFS transporter [Rhodobacteraceae bacterium MBR-64]